ncbi:hypothetical protein [Sphingomonas soli]|uniref:hypothetical protein n=1 Tax=Sphingomonas soli TaxID=266127 RepID=UPI00082DC8C0|nr:hypothetical protein [Sphingomonas soli]
MTRFPIVTGLALMLGGCGHTPSPAACPDPGAVAPPSIGTAFVKDLTGRLAGPDRENTIAEAVAEIHRRDPSLGSATVTNILIGADCPNALSRPDHDLEADRARIAGFRAQVDQLLGD